jgi:hypothetical protein
MSTSGKDDQAEIDWLRRRVTELETELIDVEAWANEVVGAAQERTYWLDRYHVDLNTLMERPSAYRIRGTLRAARKAARRVVRLIRRWEGRLRS